MSASEHRRARQRKAVQPTSQPRLATDQEVPLPALTLPATESTPDNHTPASWFMHHRIDILLSLAFVIGGFIFYLIRIKEPRQYIYDEVYHAYTAAQYAIHNGDAWVWYTKAPIEKVAYEWTHPPLGKVIMTAGILIWGDTPLGWRFTSAIFGALGLAAVYWLGLQTTGKRVVALAATLFALFDGLYFVESRTGVIDIFGTVFMTCAFIAGYLFITAPPTKVRAPLLWMGFFMGLGMATKWNAVYPSALLGLLAAWRSFQLLRLRDRRALVTVAFLALPIAIIFVPALHNGAGLKLALLAEAAILWQVATLFFFYTPDPKQPAGARAGLLQHLVWVPLGLLVLPLAVYLASYIPFFLAGHTWDELVELHRQMYWYHTNLKATHAYQSTWYQWIIDWRPVWYSVTYNDPYVANTYASGNPLLYWAFIPAILYTCWRWWSTKHPALPIFLIGFFGQWLPWALVPRIAYIYHFLPASIFAMLAVAVAVGDLWHWPGEEKTARWLAIGYIAIVIISFAFFYPIYSSVNLTKAAFESRLWLPSWR